MHLHRWYIIILISIACCATSCKKEFYANSPSDLLSFSNDTVSFDTIFTEKGSVTQYVMVKNNCEGTVKINKIYLASGAKSNFYINVNGTQGPSIENIDIASGDSVFVFIQTKLSSQNVDTALFHEEEILFDYNATQSKIVLSAWGQDVVNIKGASINSETFTAKKPYVIYDSLVVNEGETLTIEAGAKIYLHYNANIIVKGTLAIEGTCEHPVTITSDRLEEAYQLLPGQWGSIIFASTSDNNTISYAIIKNGINGLVLRGSESHEISCELANTRITNMSGNAIYATNAHINSYNCILANCEYYIINLQGGWFKGIHNTICNFGTPRGRKHYPVISIADTSANMQQAWFYNSIITGTMENEIEFTTTRGANSLPCLFQYCLIRDRYTEAESAYYKDIAYFDKNKSLFTADDSFKLDTLSQAANIGNINYGALHPTDILSHSRIADKKPDMGAIEYFYEKEK